MNIEITIELKTKNENLKKGADAPRHTKNARSAEHPAETWVVIHEEESDEARAKSTEQPPNVYYYTLRGGRVHKDRQCFGLSNAKNVFASESDEIFGKTRCGICFRRA